MKHNCLITIALASIVVLFLPLSSSLAAPFLGFAQDFAVLSYAGVSNDHSDPNLQTTLNNTLEDFDSGRSDFGSNGFSDGSDDSGNGGGGVYPVPVPIPLLLLGAGLVGLAGIHGRRTKKQSTHIKVRRRSRPD